MAVRFIPVWKFVSQIDEGVREYGAEEGVWAQEGWKQQETGENT